MSVSQIPNLTPATSLNGSEQLEAVQAGTSVRITPAQIGAYVNGTYPPPGISAVTASSPLVATTSGTAVNIFIPTAGVTNTYLGQMAAGTVKANLTGTLASPSDVTPSAVLDVIGSSTGLILYRGASAWQTLGIGTNTQILTSNGTTPYWTTLSVPSGSIAPTGVTAGTYGTASSVPQFTVLASGQISSASNVAILIPSSQVSGLGTMATQNASSVAITGGTINGVTIGGVTPGPASFTTLSASSTANFATIASGTWNGTAIGVAYGGTGATTAAGARTNLGAAASGANSDITSLTGLTTPLSETQGGTGYGSYTTGDLLYANSSTTLARLNDVATGNALISGGVGAVPAWGKIGLTTHVSGVLPTANGGTGITSFGTGVATALGQNVTGSGGIVLATSPTLVTPILGTPTSVTLTNATGLPLTTGVTGTLPVANGGTGATTLTGYLYGNGTGAFTASATIPNAGLTNSTVTIGSTAISLGGTSATLAGLTTVTLTQDPTLALQASTKQYVDGQVAAVSNTTFHASSGYATTATLTATYSNGTAGVGATLTNSGTLAALTIDGYTFTATDVTNATRVLIKDQSSGLQNGIYTVTNQGSGAVAWVLTRATDFNTVGTGPNYIETGASTFVSGGAVNGSTVWVMNTTGTITVGSTSLVWVQSSSSASVTVTSPLTKVGSVISLGTVPTTLGGTGLTTLTAYNVMLGNGTGNVAFAAPSTTGYPLLSTGATSNPAFGQLSLTAGVTGTLPVANGGTGITSFGTGVATAFGQNVTGSGGIVLATSPTLVTPALGTPTSGVMTNVTGLPLTTGVTGTLPVANGGTGTATAFTTGSVVFAGASGVYSQSNAKFFWDNTNNRLGINTGSPQTQLTVVSNTQTTTPTATLPAGTDIYIVGANAANTRITQDAYGTGSYGIYTARSARGTAASPTASQSGDTLSQFTGRGYGATGFGTASTGRFDVTAAENFTDTAQGTYASVFVTAIGANSPTEAFRFGPAGQFGIGAGTYGASGYSLVSGGASAAPSWSQISLTTGVTGTLPVANGGTNITSYAVGDLIYASGSTTLSKLAAVATGNVLRSGGLVTAPAWGQVALTTDVTGTLPIANGGTGLTSTPANGALDIGNGTGFTRTTLTQGTGITITNGAGSISIANAGVTTFSAGTTGFTPSTASSGAVTLAGTLAVANGGTGQATALTQYGVIYAASSTAMGNTAAGATGQVLIGNTGAAPSWATVSSSLVSSISFGTTGLTPATATTGAVTVAGTLAVANGGTGVTTSTGSGSNVLSTSPTLVTPLLGTPTSGVMTNVTGLPLTTGVTGTLPIGNGGTGQTTASAAFNALSPVTTTGDLIIGNGTNSAARLAIGANGYVLTSNGTTATWAASTGGVTSFSAGTTGLTPNTATTGAVTLSGTLAVSNGGTGVTTSTGSGSNVLSTSPTLVTPALGTPASGVMTNVTGLPLTTGVTGTLPVANGGTGVTTSTGTGNNVLSASPTFTGAVTATTITSPASTALTFQYGGTTGATLDTSGNLLMGTTSFSYGLTTNAIQLVKSYIIISNSTTANTNAMVFNNSNGQVGVINTNGSSTIYSTSSDYRLKENIAPMTTGLATVSALRPVTYDWISDKSRGEGFIAHELAEIVPLAVSGEKDAVAEDGTIRPQGVDYSKIVVHLVVAIQELSAKNDALATQVTELSAKVAVLDQKEV